MFYINPDYISDEKYDLAKFFNFEDDNFNVLDSYFIDNFKKLPNYGTFVITVEEFRPDLISYKIYETTNYWSLLLIYNNIVDFSELVNGKNINYFNVRDLESLYYNLNSLNRG